MTKEIELTDFLCKSCKSALYQLHPTKQDWFKCSICGHCIKDPNRTKKEEKKEISKDEKWDD